jgi:hypothetical protein
MFFPLPDFSDPNDPGLLQKPPDGIQLTKCLEMVTRNLWVSPPILLLVELLVDAKR